MPKEHSIPAKSRVAFLLLLATGITVVLLWVIKGFVVALVAAAALAGLAHPVHRRLAQWLRGREGIAAVLIVLLTLVILILPSLLLLGVLLRDAVEISGRVEPWVVQHLQTPNGFRQAMEQSPTLRKLLPYEDQIVQKAGQLAGKAASFVAQAVADGATGAARFFLMLSVMLYAMFHYLKRGRAIFDWMFAYTSLSAGDKQRLVTTFTSVARATLKGKLIIGIVQGGLAGGAYAVAGIEGAVFWGVVTALSSIVPVVGTALVWVRGGLPGNDRQSRCRRRPGGLVRRCGGRCGQCPAAEARGEGHRDVGPDGASDDPWGLGVVRRRRDRDRPHRGCAVHHRVDAVGVGGR